MGCAIYRQAQSVLAPLSSSCVSSLTAPRPLTAWIRPDKLISLPRSGPRRVRRWRLRFLERAWRIRIQSEVARRDKLIHWYDKIVLYCCFIGCECIHIFLTTLQDVIDCSTYKHLIPISHTHDPSRHIDSSASNIGLIVDIRNQRIVMSV